MLTERNYGGEFLISDANGTRSREQIKIAANQTLVAGAILGRVTTGALSAVGVAQAGNVGNGAISAITVAAGTPVGRYQVRFIEPAANAGAFVVSNPEGVETGHGTVAVAASIGGLGFTIADGPVDYAAGDGFDITVTAADAVEKDQYKGVNPAATDGSQVAVAILWDEVTTGVGQTAKAAAVVRDAEVSRQRLGFGALNAGQQVTAIAQLANVGIVVR